MARTRVRAGDAEIIREAKARFERCVTWEATARANADKDIRIAEGDAHNQWQWDTDVRNDRAGRPCLTHNKIRQHNLQIVNDARQNKAQIKVTPTGGRATYEAAQVFNGIIRRIEYQSKAIDAYSTAFWHQVVTGIGYVRVVTDYADEESFDQEIYIRRVADPNTIYIDPDAKEYDKADMKYAFVFVDIPKDTDDDGDDTESAALDHTDRWNSKDNIREAEYWRKNEDNDTLHLLNDGTQVLESEIDDMEALRPSIKRSRAVTIPLVEWFKIRGNRVVERNAWAGRYIPIVPAIGEETIIEGQLDRKGHTRSQIDAQRMYNYWASAAVEQVALQSKTPWVGPSRAFESFEKYWNVANVSSTPWLPYNDVDDSGQPIAPPQRTQPPVMAPAYVQGLQMAREDLMAVTGQYQSELGMPSNERSGVAIQQRQRQGDNATYHYIDNQAKMIRQVGRILLDLIPKIYDTNRVVKILAEDGTESDVALIASASEAHQYVQPQPDGAVKTLQPEEAKAAYEDTSQPDPRVIFNPNVGRYDVEADVGPAFGTRRQEAFNAFSQIMSQNQQAFAIVGDFWAANADFPGADELADRLKRGLPPQYKPGPGPEVQQLLGEMQKMHQNAQESLQAADKELSQLRQQVAQQQMQLADKRVDHVLDDYKAETDRLKAVGNADPELLKLIMRDLWEDMYQTDIMPRLKAHAEFEQSIQPQPEPQPGNGSADGQMVQ